MELPRIVLVGTGGTITMTPGSAGVVPTLTPSDLIEALPPLARVARLEIVAYAAKPGAAVTLEDLVAIAELIDSRMTSGCSGAVVMQGTDTIEESAFVLDLLVRSDGPVVVTGAMRAATAVSADGPANLLAAVTVAADPVSTGLGALVVLNDEVHAARYVRKCHTGSLAAFQSPGAGPLASVIEQSVVLHWRAERVPPLARPNGLDEFPVALVTLSLGDDGRLLDALPGLGYRGLVLEALGAGHVPAGVVPRLEALAREMPVVLSTRVLSGPTFSRTYGFPGSEVDLLRRGLIPAGALAAAKALQLLRILLTLGVPKADLAAHFARYGRAFRARGNAG